VTEEAEDCETKSIEAVQLSFILSFEQLLNLQAQIAERGFTDSELATCVKVHPFQNAMNGQTQEF
jgi:hypothetical protein